MSSRFNNELLNEELREHSFIELHPMHDITLINEDGIIQELESFETNIIEEKRDVKPKFTTKISSRISTMKPKDVAIAIPHRKSLSFARSNIFEVKIPDCDEFNEKQEINSSNSFKNDEHKYNLESHKRRAKYSKKIQVKTGYKWNILNNNENYSNNLPMIRKTRMNISNESCSLDQLNTDESNKSNRNRYNISHCDSKDAKYNISRKILRGKSGMGKQMYLLGKLYDQNIPSLHFK